MRGRGERDDAPPHEEVGLAPAARVEPALVEAERVLLAAEELLRADLGEHAHELRKASPELLEQARQGGARPLRRKARAGLAAERGVVLRAHHAPLHAGGAHDGGVNGASIKPVAEGGEGGLCFDPAFPPFLLPGRPPPRWPPPRAPGTSSPAGAGGGGPSGRRPGGASRARGSARSACRW